MLSFGNRDHKCYRHYRNQDTYDDTGRVAYDGILIEKASESQNLQGFMMGAEDEVRTRDPQLGRLMLYRLSYFRIK